MANNDEIMCINRINSLYENLTPAEKLIANYIIAQHETVAAFSCADLAKAAGSSPASVVRFSKKIGFDSFLEMKLSLSKQWMDQNSETIDVQETDSTAIVKQKVLIFNKNVIGGMLMTLGEEALDRAVELLCGASRILIMGDGGSGTSARNAYDVFLQLRLNCIYVTDPFFQVMQIGQLGPEDVVLAVSNSGRSKNIYENLRQAHQQKVPAIGIVGIPHSPMAKYLDVELHTNFYESTSFCDSVAAQICELSAIAVLHAMIVQRKGSADLYIGKKLGDAYDSKRVGWNE